MVLEPVLCPDCSTEDVVKHGQSKEGEWKKVGDCLRTGALPLRDA
jgi:hypothetical protein